MPELFVSTTSALEGLSDMSIGNVVGSNLCNLLLILGLSTIIKPVKFQKETRLFEIPMCLIFTVIFIVLCNTGGTINKVEAVLLLLLFLLFIIYTIFMAKKQSSQEKQKEVKTQKKLLPILKDILWIVLGVIGLKIGGDLAVNNAVNIANYFGVSEKIIGLTILAVGTSLPELVTSVTAAIKGNSDIAIGNIIGSNIFNMLMIIGVSASIKPITYNPSYNIQMIILLIAIVFLALFPFIKPKNEMSRGNGIVYIITYIVYMVLLFII